MLRLWLTIPAFILCMSTAYAQPKSKTMDKNNPLLCDPVTGTCELPDTQQHAAQASATHGTKPVKIIYYTDPICSSCWGIEPQLRRLKLEYGADIDIAYHMGGLLPDWSYNSGGISKPSDVAHHWDEVSRYYQMPIDGDVWLEDPLHSSYPPSIAFKAAQMQDPQLAVLYLRAMRELLFLQRRNITKWEYLSAAAAQVGLDTARLRQDYESGAAQRAFQGDLALAREWGVRGFPTLFVIDAAGHQQYLYGYKPYAEYEAAVKQAYSQAEKLPYDHSWQGLFAHYPTLTTREYAELSGVTIPAAEAQLSSLHEQRKLTRLDTKNGVMWGVVR